MQSRPNLEQKRSTIKMIFNTNITVILHHSMK